MTVIRILFALFVFSCGIGHWIDAFYISQGQCASFTPVKSYWNWVTAVLSVATVLTLSYVDPGHDSDHLRRRIQELEALQSRSDAEWRRDVLAAMAVIPARRADRVVWAIAAMLITYAILTVAITMHYIH